MRCFIAIELPPSIRDHLSELQKRLSPLGRSVRWTRPEQIHLTLNFLGEVPDAQVAAVCELTQQVMIRYDPFELAIGGVGFFPPRGPARVLWAGVVEPPSKLLESQRALEEALGTLGFPPEQRAYRPHLTIGRANTPIPGRHSERSEESHSSEMLRYAQHDKISVRILAALQAEEQFSAGRFVAVEATIFQSILGKEGTVHVPIARARFAPP